MAKEKESILGRTVSDKLTGFSGVVTCVAQYLDGNVTGRVEARADKDGKISAEWFDVNRLEVIPGPSFQVGKLAAAA